MASTIPRLRVSGSHREVGRAIGAACAPTLREAVDFDAQLPAGRSRAEQVALADREIWSVRPSQVTEGVVVDGRCSDLVAGPPATADGHLWVAHTNDLSPASRDDVVAIEWVVPGEPVVFTLGIGPWISIGWNSAGLSLTGNELSPNDEVVGVPRLLMVREQLTARSLDEAVGMALRRDRASSYNTVFATAEGGFANVEGSASDAEVEGLDRRGRYAHTNHYACDRMTRFEGDPVYAERSAVRLARARGLLAAAPDRSIDATWLRSALSDHETDPSICRHPERDSRVATAFWCVVDVTAGDVRFGLGNPCDSAEERFAFA